MTYFYFQTRHARLNVKILKYDVNYEIQQQLIT